MATRFIWTTEDWADAIQAIPDAGPLPARRVLVPNARVAHTLRRTLIARSASAALIGTRFLNIVQLAQELLADAGQPVPLVNERELGPVLVHDAFAQLKFARFRRDDLLELPGWDQAFVRTLCDLEGALLSPQDLTGVDPHVADVGRVFAFLRERAELVTTAQLLQRAAAIAEQAGAARKPTLAVITGFESRAEMTLLQALPDVVWALWATRPHRALHARRTSELLGSQLDAAQADDMRPRTALEHLRRHLFDDRASSAAPQDESVTVAIYAGVHEEVEAAVSWVVDQVLNRGVHTHDIAILTPAAEPYGGLLRARLAALPWPEGQEQATFSERGIPLVERADGSRLLAVIRALRDGLSREALAPLLPILRTSDPDISVRGLSRAWELLNELAAVGGTRGDLAAGTRWGEVWRSGIERLGAVPAGVALDPRDLARRSELQRLLTALSPALDALSGLLQAVISGQRLSVLWEQLSELAQSHVKLPHAAPPVIALMDGMCARFVGDGARQPSGLDALAWLEDTLCESVAMSGRFGEPAVYLGTLAGVRGLSFAAVRVLGLVEGALPSASREDPVLPDGARRALSSLLPTAPLRAHRQLASFDDAVRAARERLALSAARVSVEGSVRQPAAVLLDLVRALTGSNHALEDKLEDAAAVGRERERKVRERCPISAAARFARVARRDRASLPPDVNPALSLDALRAIRDRKSFGAQDGLLAGALPMEKTLGMSAERPISASRLDTLLSCPHRFLYESMLGFRGPTWPLAAYSINVMLFGSWLHAIAEEFWAVHGADVAGRVGSSELHLAALKKFACERFEGLRASYPFANEASAQATREELCDQLTKLFKLDWDRGEPKTFIGVERQFGYDAPCILETEAGPLYVRGKIDRLDRDGETLLVRDIKTGASKPRAPDDPPDLKIDLQLALYARVAQLMASTWNTPSRVGVAYIYLRSGEPERSWIGDDYARLEQAASVWFAAAREVLEHSAFVRSPNPDDCMYCQFKPVCAPEMERASAVLHDLRVPRRVAQLKAVETNE